MSSIPLLHILFYLALLLRPAGTSHITIAHHGKRAEWTRQSDGWHAADATRGAPVKDLGVWNLRGKSVNVTGSAQAGSEDVSTYIQEDAAQPDHRTIRLGGKPLQIERRGAETTLKQATGGLLDAPAVITFADH